VNPRYLIVAAVLGAGCEQWKAPKRIHELEGRVDELAKEVAGLKDGSGASKPKADAHAKAGPGEHAAGAGPDAHGEPAKERAATVEHPPDAGAKHDDPMERLKAVIESNTIGKGGSHDAPHWSYEGKTGPAAWGVLDPAWELCGSGKAQSPIDIEPKAGAATPIVFHYKPTAATIIDNGHTLQVNLAAGSSIDIDNWPYDLVQFHFHSPSEHTIAGEHYPLEVHLVHKDAKGKLAVIGVLYDVGADSKALAGVWSKWPRKVGVEDKLRKPFDPSALLPETRTAFRYAGSLTTPPCSEGVVWNVMRRTLSESRKHLTLFSQHYSLNARDPQPLNDRKIE
jgi:carbonic anhydrase